MREWWTRRKRDQDLDDEIAHDLWLEAEERVRAGLTRAEAERASRDDFGDLGRIKAAARATWRPDAPPLRLADVTTDLWHGLRRLGRERGFTATALLVLALGIAVNVVVFSIADRTIFHPLDIPAADRVVVFETLTPTGADVSAAPVMFDHWRAQTSVVESVAAFQHVVVTDASGSSSEPIHAGRVSAAYFRAMGAATVLGRTFTDEEDRPDGPAVAVVSYGLWTRRFPDGHGLGATLHLNGASYTIIGVLSASFHDDYFGPASDVWLPLQLDPAAKTIGHFFGVAGRLRDGVTLAQAQAELQLSTAAFRRAFPTVLPTRGVFTVVPLADALAAPVRPVFLVLFAAVVFVLLIACSNLANLLLVQGARRRQEIGIRVALGAGRRRIVQQLLTESLLLAVGGGAAGLALGWAGIQALPALAVPQLDDVAAAGLDRAVLAFTVVISVGTGLLFGLMPALRASRVDLAGVMSAGDARLMVSPGRRVTEATLLIVQMTLALVLLAGASLFMRTVVALTHVAPGFDPDHVLTLRTPLGGSDIATTARAAGLFRRGLDALPTVPGVAISGMAYGVPLENGGGLPFEIVGRPLPPGQSYHGGASWMAVGPGYIEALGIPVIRGRALTADDGPTGTPVALINAAMARQYWPGQNPIGQSVIFGHGTGPQFQDEPVRTIVGVVGDVKMNRLQDRIGAEIYEPMAQLPDAAQAFIGGETPVAWIVRLSAEPAAVAHTLETHLEAALTAPVSDVRSMDEVVSRSIFRQRLSMWLMAAFGATALLLAALGLYGLVSYSVEARRREIGVRLALGAGPARVRRMVIWAGLRLTAVGAVCGVAGALGLARLVGRLLYGVPTTDPVTFVGVPIVVAVVALMAVWLPARRATRVDPVVALRYE